MQFTKQPIRKMFKKAGAKRVSDKAVTEMAKILEEKTKLIVTEANRLSEHAGRRTVMKEDIKMARRMIE